MEHSSALPFLPEVLLFLALAGILIPLLQRFRVNQVLGFLVVGLMVGPYGLALWVDHWPWLQTFTFPREQEVSALAELGVIFLMFLIGLELSAKRMWAMRRWVFLGGMAQFAGTAALIASVLYLLAGYGTDTAILLGLILALSSTAVVMQMLSQQRAMATPMGQAAFAILMMQDFAVVPLLILVDLLANKSAGAVETLVLLTLVKSVGTVALILLLGRRVIGPVFRCFARDRQPEVFVALTLLLTLGIAAATEAAGLSMALGAFLAGLLLAETEYRHEVEITIEPFKGLLMGLFFMTVGMGIDLRAVAEHWFLISLSVLGLMLLKALVAGLVLRLGRLSLGKALEGGLLLSQGGEFAFVVIGYAASVGLLVAEQAQLALLTVSLSLMLTPPAARLGHLISERLEIVRLSERQAAAGMPEELSGHVLIAGFGRVGRLVAEVLSKQGVPYVAIDLDAHRVYQLRRQGYPVFYGNAAKPELLRKLCAAEASVLVVTMDKPGAAMHTVRAVRQEYPKLPLFVRSHDEPHARELHKFGANAVVPETLEAALKLSFFTLQTLGMPETEITASLDLEREQRTGNTPL